MAAAELASAPGEIESDPACHQPPARDRDRSGHDGDAHRAPTVKLVVRRAAWTNRMDSTAALPM